MCRNGDVIFIWDVLINEIFLRNMILYNNSWINLNDIRYIVKDVFLYEFIRIIIDVLGYYFCKFDFWIYIGIILYLLNERIY